MKTNILNGILIVLGIGVLLLSAFPFGMLVAIAFWVYLGVMYRKRKGVFREDELGLFENQMRILKRLSVASLVFFVLAIIGIVVHNVQSAQSGTEETLYFFIGIISLYLFILASSSGLIIFIKGKSKVRNKTS